MRRKNVADMDNERIIEAIDYIQEQIDGGYVELSRWDVAEIEIIELALKEYKINHGLNMI
jgi:hypothetical protein